MREPVILVGGPLDGQRHMVPSPPPEAWNFTEMSAEPMPSLEALQMEEAQYVRQHTYMREEWHAYGRKYHWFRWQRLPKEEFVLELMQGYRRPRSGREKHNNGEQA